MFEIFLIFIYFILLAYLIFSVVKFIFLLEKKAKHKLNNKITKENLDERN